MLPLKRKISIFQAFFIVSAIALLWAVPKYAEASYSNYGGDVLTIKADSTNFQSAPFTAVTSKGLTPTYGFWYTNGLTCASATNQLLVGTSTKKDILIFDDATCTNMGSGLLRVTRVSGSLVNGTTYFASFGFNTSRTVYGNGVSDFKFVLSDSSATPTAPVDPSVGGTRVIAGTFSPPSYSTTTSAIPISFDYYVDPDDVYSPIVTPPLTGLLFPFLCVDVQSRSVLPFRQQICVTNYSVGSVGSFSTTTVPVPDGMVDFTVYLGNPYSTSTESTFYLLNGSYLAAVGGYQNALEIFQQSYGSSTNSVANVAEKCSPIVNNIATAFLNTNFNVPNCLYILFHPDFYVIKDSFDSLRNTVLHVFPLGYVTDFVSIIATSSTSSLPVLSATIPNVLPGGGSHMTLSLTNVFDPFLYATSSRFTSPEASSSATFLDYTLPYWRIVVYLAAFLYLLRRVVGSGLIGNFMTNKKDDN